MNRLQQAVYETLSSSEAPLRVSEVYAGVKQKVPDLCDDSVFPCPWCKQKHPLWQHKAAWALQTLKGRKLVESAGRGFWRASKLKVEREAVPAAPTVKPERAEPLHESLKAKIREIGEALGKQTRTEYSGPPYVYDVVWKEIEALPPSHVFEIQDKGNVNGALSKLQHARDVWGRPELFLVITGERDRAKVDLLLKPHWQGAFHRISRQTLVLTPEEIEDIHRVFSSHRETIRRFVEY